MLHNLTQVVEGGSLLRLAVPALHHDLVAAGTQNSEWAQGGVSGHPPQPTDPLGMNTRPTRWGGGSHFTGGVVRLGHPVPTLDLIVESRIHHHAGVGCAA